MPLPLINSHLDTGCHSNTASASVKASAPPWRAQASGSRATGQAAAAAGQTGHCSREGACDEQPTAEASAAAAAASAQPFSGGSRPEIKIAEQQSGPLVCLDGYKLTLYQPQQAAATHAAGPRSEWARLSQADCRDTYPAGSAEPGKQQKQQSSSSQAVPAVEVRHPAFVSQPAKAGPQKASSLSQQAARQVGQHAADRIAPCELSDEEQGQEDHVRALQHTGSRCTKSFPSVSLALDRCQALVLASPCWNFGTTAALMVNRWLHDTTARTWRAAAVPQAAAALLGPAYCAGGAQSSVLRAAGD